MQFEGSTQAKKWLFSEESLQICRRRAISMKPQPRAHKFASGFHSRLPCEGGAAAPNESCLKAADHETLVRFHAHQIQSLIGPSAILPELRRNGVVLSTAVMLFRRFFLSNSTINVSPRKIAVAAAFFASKLEEDRVEISLLAHSTTVVEQNASGNILCRGELSSVSITEIEDYESILMEGLNYEFICHHPHASIGFLVKDIVNFVQSSEDFSLGVDLFSCNKRGADCWVDEQANALLRRAIQIVDRANIFSDAVFLFAPGHISFAIAAIVFESIYDDGGIGDIMQDYLVTKWALNTEEELIAYSREVSRVVSHLLSCDSMDLHPKKNALQVVSERTEQLRQVLNTAKRLRSLKNKSNDTAEILQTGKRKRSASSPDFSPPRCGMSHKMAKVTPTSAYDR